MQVVREILKSGGILDRTQRRKGNIPKEAMVELCREQVLAPPYVALGKLVLV